MSQVPLSNEALIELLDNVTFRFGELPESFTGDMFIRLIQSRLKAAPCPTQAMGKEEAKEPKPVQNWFNDALTTPDSQMPINKELRLIDRWSNHVFTDEYLNNLVTVYADGCFVIELGRVNYSYFKRAKEKRSTLLETIGNVFNHLKETNRWPAELKSPNAIFYNIHQRITEGNIHGLTENPNTRLIVGNVESIPRFNTAINLEAIEDLNAQLREVNKPYPGWIIQTGYTEETL